MFSIVIPTYNRLNNLQLVLAALHAQQNAPEFEVILADDGSTDGTHEWFERHANDWVDNTKYIPCGPHMGFRPHRTRNIGAAWAEYPYLYFVDSDIMLNPHALEYQKKIREHEAFKSVVVVGMYHFAREGLFTPDAVVQSWDLVMRLVPPELSKGPPVPGRDCRIAGFHDEIDPKHIITEYDGLGFFSGNYCWPKEVFWGLGGYDELMPSGMGEDAELGQRMRLNKVPVIQFGPVYGVHMHHWRDVQKSYELVQKSIKYIDMKYEIGTYAKSTKKETDPREKDLSMWYTKDYGAKLVKKEDEDTVYAITPENGWRVGIPALEWIDLLDFTWDDVEIVDQAYLDQFELVGTIRK